MQNSKKLSLNEKNQSGFQNVPDVQNTKFHYLKVYRASWVFSDILLFPTFPIDFLFEEASPPVLCDAYTVNQNFSLLCKVSGHAPKWTLLLNEPLFLSVPGFKK